MGILPVWDLLNRCIKYYILSRLSTGAVNCHLRKKISDREGRWKSGETQTRRQGMGQNPTTRSRTQDRNNSGNQENKQRPTILNRMGHRLGRNPEPPPWISRYGDSRYKPPEQQRQER